MVWGRSPTLNLDLCWDDGRLRYYDPVVGNYLLNWQEERDAKEVAQTAAQTAQAATETERAARQSAEDRVAELEAELLGRLRGETPIAAYPIFAGHSRLITWIRSLPRGRLPALPRHGGESHAANHRSRDPRNHQERPDERRRHHGPDRGAHRPLGGHQARHGLLHRPLQRRGPAGGPGPHPAARTSAAWPRPSRA